MNPSTISDMDGKMDAPSRSAALRAVEALMWTMTVAVAWWWTLAAPHQDPRSVIVFTSVLSIAHGAWAFLRHGQAGITTTGLFALSTAMFIGLSGLILAREPFPVAGFRYLAMATVAGLTAQIATVALAWGQNRQPRGSGRWADRRAADWVAGVGLIALGLSLGAAIAIPSLRAWTEAAAFTAILLLATGLVWRDNARLLSFSTVVVAAALVLYAEGFHSGSGRLRIVALVCSVSVIYAARFQRRRIKIAILAAVPAALMWLANQRLELQESLAVGASAGRTGLESMVAPLHVFSQLLQALHERGFVPSYGYNLLSVPALVVPESLWPGQPRALGYELVQISAPERYSPDGGYSVVAASTGEGIYNFGWWGLPLVIIAGALALRVLDGLLVRRLDASQSTILGVLGVVFLAMLAGAVADYTWSGVHTYVARTLFRLPLFLAVLGLAWTHHRFALRPPKRARSYVLEPRPARS